MANAIYQTYADYILATAGVPNAVFTGTAPLNSTYSLSDFAFLRPDWRVKFGSGTVTITITLPIAKRADIFALPMHNLSGAVLTLTNGSGLSQAITLATLSEDSIPLTTVVDLTIGTPVAATRTSNVWNLVISGNAVNVTLGGAIWLSGNSRSFNRNFKWGFTESEQHGLAAEHINEYLTAARLGTFSKTRSLTCQTLARDQGVTDFRAWYRANCGRAHPSLLWPDPSVNDAYLGVWQPELSVVRGYPNASDVALKFDELSKGIPLL
jgi:hypothetical protein